MESHSQCGVQPNIIFLILTLLMTGFATALLCTAMITNQWEHVTWDRGKLDTISTQMPEKEQIQWFLGGQVARVNLSGLLRNPYANNVWHKQSKPPGLFFVSMHGGLWTLCTLISEKDTETLRGIEFPIERCTYYLTPEIIREDGGRAEWQHRMQNLSISCALVCLIILGCSALVGAFGVIKQQISAVLVTGVMYLLAATFAFFTLAIIHLKRSQTQADCPKNQTTFGLKIDGVLLASSTMQQPYLLGSVTEYFEARIATTGWSLQLGWGGVGACVLVSILWILLSKIMRYNPLSNLLTTLTML